jgi:mRNA interferase YafQ
LKIGYHAHFRKSFKKLDHNIQAKFFARLKLFEEDNFAIELHNHALRGEFTKHRSINITGDIMAIYKVDGEIIKFVFIGSHGELYG